MADDIKVYRNILSQDEYDKCSEIIKNASWKFTGRSNDHDATTFWYLELNHLTFFNTVLKEKIEAVTGRKFKLNRVYANGQTFGQDGGFHVDDERPGCYTFLMYMNPISDEEVFEVGGATQIKDKQGNLVCITPYVNSAVLFPSNLMHRGMAPTRFYTYLRVTIVWKLQDIST
jgi:hypothetical protein